MVNATLTINGVITGPGGIAINGNGFSGAASGVLSLNGVNTYQGKTTINTGTLVANVANALPASTALIFGAPSATTTVAMTVNQDNTVASLSGGNSNGGVITIASGKTLTVGDATDTTFAGRMSGSGRFLKQGAGTLTLSGGNTYTGTFTLNAGTVTVTTGAALCGGVCDIVINGGTLNLNNAAQTVENLNGAAGTINLGTGHVLTVNPIATSTFSGSISGTGAVTKTATSTEVLAGVNSYTGATKVNAGTLRFAKEVSLYNNTPESWIPANIVVSDAATLALNVGGSGEFTASDAGILLGLGTATGGFLNGSSIGLDTTNATGGDFALSLAIANPNGGANALGVRKLGDNSLTLSGASTYTGGTIVAAGTLVVAGASASLGAGSVTVQNTAVKLTIQTGVLNAIADTATLSLAGGGAAGVADVGYVDLGASVNETVFGLTLGGVAQANGTYGSSLSSADIKNDEYFSGTGVLTVVPEAGTLNALFGGLGVLVGLQRFRRRS